MQVKKDSSLQPKGDNHLPEICLYLLQRGKQPLTKANSVRKRKRVCVKWHTPCSDLRRLIGWSCHKKCLYLLLHCRVTDIEKVTMTTSEKKKRDSEGREKIIRQIDMKTRLRWDDGIETGKEKCVCISESQHSIIDVHWVPNKWILSSCPVLSNKHPRHRKRAHAFSFNYMRSESLKHISDRRKSVY